MPAEKDKTSKAAEATAQVTASLEELKVEDGEVNTEEEVDAKDTTVRRCEKRPSLT